MTPEEPVYVVAVLLLGAIVGSFLNVVIYRLPAGMSLGKPKSRCPRCETPLSAKDNIPVLGWLLLKGRCRYCSLPVAARYPVIEALCGGIFLLLMFGELLTGASNLPLRHPDHFAANPRFWLIWFAKPDLLAVYLFHCCLLLIVLAAAMIGYDGHRPAAKLRWFGIVTGLTVGTFWMSLRPVPAFPYPPALLEMNWMFVPNRHLIGISATGLLDGIAGVCGGIFVGCLAAWLLKSGTAPAPASGPAIRDGFIFVGTFLGWQAVGMLGVLAFPLLLLLKTTAKLSGRRLLKYASPAFFGLCAVFILTWQDLHVSSWMIGIFGWKFTQLIWWQDWLMTAAGLIVTAAVGRYGITVQTEECEPAAAQEPSSDAANLSDESPAPPEADQDNDS